MNPFNRKPSASEFLMKQSTTSQGKYTKTQVDPLALNPYTTVIRPATALKERPDISYQPYAKTKKTDTFPPVRSAKEPRSKIEQKSTGWDDAKKEVKGEITGEVRTERRQRLSDEQKEVLDLIVTQKKSVFFTGNAGTGKSFLMREVIRQLRKTLNSDKLIITASTGIAACNIGGTTLHSFAGAGLCIGDRKIIAKKVCDNRKSRTRWQNAQVLIVDEISMVDGEFFETLDYIGKETRSSQKPFGGIQLVLCGDFMQLPPVSKGAVKFAFESVAWRAAVQTTFQACTNIQKDQVFVNILNEMRIGQMSDESVKKLMELSRPLIFTDGIEPTQLFSLRDQVDRANTSRLSGITGKATVFTAIDVGINDQNDAKKLKDSCMAPDVLELKVGAQVMLIKNHPDGSLVNGSLGTVISFTEKGLPFVKFLLVDGRSYECIVEKSEWVVEITAQSRKLTRIQVPLILAYAMSIHKAQGQTITRLKVDISKVFETGQAYVALSRATSMEVVGFAREKVRCHPKVLDFHRHLGQTPVKNI